MDDNEQIKNIARELGRRGGNMTLKLYGKDHFRRIGQKGGRKKTQKRRTFLPLDK